MEEYVYDLYYAQTCNDVWFESNQIMIQYPEYLVSEHNSDDEDKSTTDSNSESHWRNDYPDSETDSDNFYPSTPENCYYSDSYDEDLGELENVDQSLTLKLRSQLRNYRISSRSKPERRETSDSDSNEEFGIL